MKKLIKINLPIRPLSVNAAWQGRRFKSKMYKQYEREITPLLAFTHGRIEGLVEVHYRFFLKNWKVTDGDNLVKVTQDFIVKRGIIDDDRHIMRYIIDKVPSKIDKIEVEITPYELG